MHNPDEARDEPAGDGVTATSTRHSQHGRYPRAASVDDFRNNLTVVQRRIDAACKLSGRDPADVRLLPVSKTMDETHIRMAYAAGCRMVGENKVQEASQKWGSMADLIDLRWSVIGHLQTNKAKIVAKSADEFQALDSLRLAEALERRLQIEGRALDIFVQVNSSGEASKYGIAPEQVVSFIRQLTVFPALRVRGLMTLALFSSDATRVRQCFVRMRDVRQRVCDALAIEPGHFGLSMGMSGDFEIAIQEGATVVRVGQAIFGARSTPDSHYWPSNGESDSVA